MRRRRHAMFALQRKARRRRWLLSWSWPRRAALLGVLVVFVGLLVIGLGWPQAAGKPGSAQVTLQAEKRLFGASERPTLHLHFAPAHRVGLLQGKVFADSLPKVDVTFKDVSIDTPVTITPDAGGDTITIAKDQSLPKAGTYTVTATGQTNTGEDFTQKTTFAWGVMAINTDKTVYAPGETAHMQLGVVGPGGNTICGAAVQVTVTNPSGNVANVPFNASSSCRGDQYSDSPDYTGDYQTGAVGTYTMHVGVKGTTDTLSSTFKVASNVPFDVTRTGLTRLFPTRVYKMDMTIKANQDFTGQVKEVLPSGGFKVLFPPPSATVTNDKDQVIITWDVSWKAGTTQDLAYSFYPPVQSPAFYEFLPATFTDHDGKLVFQEARGWQYVGDATIAFVAQTFFTYHTAAGSAQNVHTESISATAGDTLIVFYSENASGGTNGMGTISDSTLGCTGSCPNGPNVWTNPTTNPSQNPPQNFITSISSVTGIAYAYLKTSITTLTVGNNTGANLDAAYGFNAVEFSNIDSLNPVDKSISASNATPTLSGSTYPISSPTITVNACDVPTTAQEMRGGNWFCSTPNELVVALISDGKNQYGTATSPSNNDGTGTPAGAPVWITSPTATGPEPALTDIVVNSSVTTTSCPAANTSTCGVAAYDITGVSGSYTSTWQLSLQKGGGACAMVFRQQLTSSDVTEENFFWSK